MKRPPRLAHVKHVLRRGKWYSYFATGTKDSKGKPIFTRLPEWGAVGFFDSYASCMAGRTQRQNVRTYTVGDLARDYRLSSKFADRADATRKSYGLHLDKVAAIWGAFPVDSLQPVHVRRALESEGWGPATRNMVLAVVGVIYKWGRQNEKAAIDPTSDIERYQTGEHDPWPEDVLEAALQADDDTVRLAVHLLYFTGQRIGDVCAMRWGDIREGRITVKPAKTIRFRKTLDFPLAAELKAELDRTPRTDLVILAGITPATLRYKLQAFTRSLGVDTVPHGLRKNAVNALLEAGCMVAEVQAITGQTMEVVEHYAAQVNRRKLGGAAMLKFDLSRRNKGG